MVGCPHHPQTVNNNRPSVNSALHIGADYRSHPPPFAEYPFPPLPRPSSTARRPSARRQRLLVRAGFATCTNRGALSP
eukprot:364804-Chlamydomonas_euryale.AAC.10